MTALSPPLLWQDQVAGWRLLGFEVVRGRHADYAPGSADLPKVLAAMRQLTTVWCPRLPQLKRAEQRWRRYVAAEDLRLLAGDTLLHTDYNPDNVLIDGGPVARLVDWAWPTLGAPWIDPACLIVRLVFAGHTPEQAEAVAGGLPAWQQAPDRGLDVFAAALDGMWGQIAAADPSPWKAKMGGGRASMGVPPTSSGLRPAYAQGSLPVEIGNDHPGPARWPSPA